MERHRARGQENPGGWCRDCGDLRGQIRGDDPRQSTGQAASKRAFEAVMTLSRSTVAAIRTSVQASVPTAHLRGILDVGHGDLAMDGRVLPL